MSDYRVDLAVRLICPDCQESPPDIREEYSDGNLVCGGCGLVLGDRIVDTRSEWRNFAGDEGDDPSRVGAAADPLMEGIEILVTKIAWKDGGSGMAVQLRRTIAKVSAADTRLSLTYHEIKCLGDRMSLDTNTIDAAKSIFKHTNADHVLRNYSVDAQAAGCIMKACRGKGSVIRTFNDMENYSGASKKEIGRCIKKVDAYFKTNPPMEAIVTVAPVGQAQPELLLPRFTNHLGLPFYSVQYAETVIERYREHVTDSRRPLTIAAAAVYFVSHLLGKGRTTREVAEVSGVKEKTIDGAYRVMYARREMLAPEEDVKGGRAVLSRLPHRN